MERISWCFVQGCFTYDLAVQIVGTLGALLVALAVYRISRRSEEADAKEDRAEQWRLFNAQAELTREQITRAVEAMNQDREQWQAERFTQQLQRAHREVDEKLATAQAVFFELRRVSELVRQGNAHSGSANVLDGLMRNYLLFDDATVGAIATAHDAVHEWANNTGGLTGHQMDRLGRDISAAIDSLDPVIEKLLRRQERLQEMVASDAGLGELGAETEDLPESPR